MYKTHTILKDGSVQPFTTETRGDTIALKFSVAKTSMANGGVYKCQAVSGGDVTRERSFTLNVLKLVAPSITGFDNEMAVQKSSDKKGNFYVLDCDAGKMIRISH